MAELDCATIIGTIAEEGKICNTDKEDILGTLKLAW